MGEWRYRTSITDLGIRCRLAASFTLSPFYTDETAPDTHYTGGWVGPRARMDLSLRRIGLGLLGCPAFDLVAISILLFLKESSRFEDWSV
jgi:hypothetical protein